MMDDFAGLAWNDTVIKPKKPQTLGSSLSKPSPVIAIKPYDAFASIAAGGSSRPLHTGIDSNVSGRSGRSTPASRPSGSSSLASNHQDAFSGLLPLGMMSNSNMSIAERQAQAERERAARKTEELHSQSDLSSLYDSTANLGPTTTAVAGSSSSSSQTGWPSLSFPPTIVTPSLRPSSATPSSNSHTSVPTGSMDVNDAWGDIDLLSLTNTPAPIHAPTPAPGLSMVADTAQDPFDFSAFGAPLAQRAPSPSSPRSRSRTPGDFDFGHEGSGGLRSDDDSEGEDLLGDFGRPVESRPQSTSQATDGFSRGASPPPHIVGQIVEMGFTPQEARAALVATGSGVDVQAAIESLLGGSQDFSQTPGRPSPPRRRTLAEEEVAAYEWRERRHLQPESTGRRERSSSPHELEQHHSGGSGLNAAQLREQADKYLAQASEIGLSVFNKANAFLSQGKAQLQRVYEERTATSGNIVSDERSKMSGRPRWATGTSATVPEQVVDVELVFQDDNSEDEKPYRQRPNPGKRSQTPRPEPQATPPPEAELFSDSPGATYVSPHRRRPNRNVVLSNTNSSGTRTSSSPAPRPLSPAHLRMRNLVSAPPSAIVNAKLYRTKGTEMFRLGRFAEAEASYTSAIALIPPGHLYLIPLHNNRAAARLKTGDSKGAIADCTNALQIIGDGFHPTTDEPAPPFDGGEVLNLGDALVKALRKRAEACEGEEKWNQAKSDWEKLITVDWPAGQRVRQEALRGAARSRKMLTAGPGGQGLTPSVVNLRHASPQPRSQLSSPPSEASTRFRAAHQAEEIEEAERAKLKDAIDSKIGTWKGGKESNLRALIASLDTVLWPELGWQRVGMHELVTPAQVKMRYMKAIARVHPDKLSVMNTTVEHRLIANGVFGTLNEAWNMFKP